MVAVLDEKLRALDSLGGREPTLAELEKLSREWGEQTARWVAAQARCRKKAEAKFTLAGQMLLDPDGLAMSTHEQVARWRASRFPVGELVVDLTCGIGADLIALASRGPAVGVEVDPDRAEYARHNLRVHGLDAEVVVADCLEWLDLHGHTVRWAFLDPARRSRGKRFSRTLEEYAPRPADVLARIPNLRLGAVKLSPMLADEHLLSVGSRVEFVSFGWECREALAWVGSEVEPGMGAVKVDSLPHSPQ